MDKIIESLYSKYNINESYELNESLTPGKIYKINCSHNRLAKFQYVDYDENGYKFKPLNAIAKKFAKEMAESDNLEYDGFLYLDDYGIDVYLDKYKINESLNDVITIDVDWAVGTDEIDRAIKETEAFGIKVKDVHDSPYNVNYEAVIQGTKPKLYKYLTSDLYGMDEDNVKRIYPELVE